MEDGGRVTCVDKQGEEWLDLDMAVWKREWQAAQERQRWTRFGAKQDSKAMESRARELIA